MTPPFPRRRCVLLHGPGGKATLPPDNAAPVREQGSGVHGPSTPLRYRSRAAPCAEVLLLRGGPESTPIATSGRPRCDVGLLGPGREHLATARIPLGSDGAVSTARFDQA